MRGPAPNLHFATIHPFSVAQSELLDSNQFSPKKFHARAEHKYFVADSMRKLFDLTILFPRKCPDLLNIVEIGLMGGC